MHLKIRPLHRPSLLPPLLVLMLTLAGCSTTPTSTNSRLREQVAQREIERRLNEILDAASSKDFERLDQMHLYGPRFTRFSASSPVQLDAAATRRLEHLGLAKLSNLKMRMESLRIDLFGPVGIATFILDYHFDVDGGTGPLHQRERSTLVFVNEEGSWRIAHEHLSPIAPETAADPGRTAD